jgi:hypothetical protein
VPIALKRVGPLPSEGQPYAVSDSIGGSGGRGGPRRGFGFEQALTFATFAHVAEQTLSSPTGGSRATLRHRTSGMPAAFALDHNPRSSIPDKDWLDTL